MIDFAQPDECCGAALSAALLSGILEYVEEWTHQECGQVWRCKKVGDVRHWQPVCDMMVFPDLRWQDRS